MTFVYLDELIALQKNSYDLKFKIHLSNYIIEIYLMKKDNYSPLGIILEIENENYMHRV